MMGWGNGQRLLWLVMCLLTIGGCESKGPQSREGESAERLIFAESSEGLPSSGRWRQGMAFSDINHDGRLDILAGPPRLPQKEEERPSVWHGNAAGTWSRAQIDLPLDIEFGYGCIAVGRYNRDEWVDIAFAIHDSGLKAFKGTAEGRYWDFSNGLPPKEQFSSRAIVSADFNKDGLSDIACVSEGRPAGEGGGPVGGVLVCYGSDADWSCVPIGGEEAKGLVGDQLTTGDVNGDGHVDIAVGSLEHTKDFIVWMNDGKGGFSPFNKGLPQNVHYPSVALADIDGDGRDDLIASITGFGREGVMGLKAFLSRPDGFKEISDGLPDREVYFSVAACDLDRDGDVDIVGGTAAGGLKIFSYEDGRWREMEVSGLPVKGLEVIYNVYCVDLNGDGNKDIAVISSSDGEAGKGGIRVFLNDYQKN
ncbi:MAG: repeat-containing protein [Thermodesulfobacteriota bacterium]|nr:repeat-containing protein [Thermodesulfobacteriota bacterium]